MSEFWFLIQGALVLWMVPFTIVGALLWWGMHGDLR